MINWHLFPQVGLEMAYSYDNLDRFNLSADTQFFQARIQFQY